MSLLRIPSALWRRKRRIAPLGFLGLGGCGMQVIYPAGDVASQQADILLISTFLMLLIIIPVMALTALFAWRFRASNTAVEHRPDWDHSTALELVIWSAPLLIIIALGAITWISTHTLDPYRPLDRLAPGKPKAVDAKPLEIDVVALDWKWLFIYPEQGIATVNTLALPTDREVRFRITSSSVMNSFYVPALAGQIYAMPGMETKLHAVLNRTGTFEGISANYSGAGFSGMRFTVHGVDEAGFAAWVARMKTGGKLLDRPAYLALERPSENSPARYWSSIDPALFHRVVNMCVRDGQPCMIDTMKKDMGHSTVAHDMDDMPMGALPAVNAGQGGKHAEGALTRSTDELGAARRPAADHAGHTPNAER